MWSRLSRAIPPTLQPHRTFLSEAYKCTDSWNARLSTPILQKIKPETFYYELDHKFQQQGKCSAIDIDIFANKLSDGNYVDELADLMHKLRMTDETTNTLESTGHALVRTYLEHAETKELLTILNDRLSYGVFLDAFTANLALDKLIRAKDFTSAARIASLVMLQEEFENEITSKLSLYACIKYLQNPTSFEETLVAETISADEPVAAPTKKPKKKEEIKVRVKFIRNEFFDDHFDLRDGPILVGKTLWTIGKGLESSALGNSVRLLGLFHYAKYAEASEVIRSLPATNAIYKEVVDSIMAGLENIPEPQADVLSFTESIRSLAESSVLISEDFEKAICAIANDAVQRTETKDIDGQKKIYSDWCQLRDERLGEELDRLQRTHRLADIERITRDMESEEQKLWFFENEDKIDLQIDGKKVFYRKRWFGKKKKPRVVDAGYVPPEIVRKTNK